MIERGHKKGNKADRANRPVAPMRPMGLIGTMGLIGLMSLMSCSAEPEAEAPVPATGTAICFSGQQGEEQVTRGNKAYGAYGLTRATTPLKDKGVTYFTVWAYKNMSESSGNYGDLQNVIPGYTVKWSDNSAGTTTTNSDGWEYVNQQNDNQEEQTIKYWDWGAAAYRFFGVTGNEDYYSTNETYGANKTYEITVEVNALNPVLIPYVSQLWFSTGNISNYPTREFGKPVQLVFTKPYSKVRFIYNYVTPREGVVLANQSFKPTNGNMIARVGTVTVSYPLTGTAKEESYTVKSESAGVLRDFTEDYDPDNDAKTYYETDNGWYSVLPNNGQGSYTLSVAINNDRKTCVVPAEFMRWLPGYSYTYIFKINAEGGVEIQEVKSAYMTSWVEMEGDYAVYNW